MSRNFELLQKAAEEERERQRMEPAVVTPAGATNGWTPAAEGTVENAILPQALEGLSREELNKLTQRLFQPDGARVVVFTSVERGAGCTWLAAQVAQTLAAQGRNSVCVVDGNFRAPALHEVFALNNQQGLADAILDGGRTQDYLRNTAQPNLWVLTNGTPEKAVQAVGSTQMLLENIRQLRAQFEYVVIDSAPMNLFHDALTLGSAGDGIALILKANSSRREIAQKMLHEAKSANVRVLGAVLNQRQFPVPESVYRRL
jgi:capsular exopolysaccharide synthesis family protein